MASAATENGETIDESPLSDNNGTPKVNGEINGSYDEPMEVDENHVITGKTINSSELMLLNENKKNNTNSASEVLEQLSSISESSNMEMDTGDDCEMPENKATSNGYSEEHEQKKASENEENDINEDCGGNDSCVDEEDKFDNETKSKEDDEREEGDDELMILGVEVVNDPLSVNSCSQEEDKDYVVDVIDAECTSDVEEIEEKDPLTLESDQSANDTDVSKMLEAATLEEDFSIDDSKLDDSCKENEDTLFEQTNNVDESQADNNSVKLDNESTEAYNNDEGNDDKKDEHDKSKTSDENEKTPDKVKKKKVQQQLINITPRRSSRNVNKPKTYIDEPDIKGDSSPKRITDDPDIEEIVPQDPLAMDSPVSDKRNKKTVVVNDPKRLVEIASGNKLNKPGKKEPTLVIIDTNSILSGRGPVPVSPSSPLGHGTSVAGPSPHTYSVLPVALPAQGMYPQPLRNTQVKAAPSPPASKPPVILPSLTDDMYVVEAPSFIVPYVYEKPPIKPLKGFVEEVEQAIKEIKARLEQDKEQKKKESKDFKEDVDNDCKKDEKCEKGKNEKDDKMDVDSEDTKSIVDSETSSANDKAEVLQGTEKAKDEVEKTPEKTSEEDKSEDGEKVKKQSNSYFDNPLGKFFIQIGVNLVQEHVQTDLLRSQKRKKEREGAKCTPEVQQAMNSLIRSLEFSKETNEPFKLELKKCEFCSFKTESALVMAHHLETPHMRNYVYRCNFCTLEVRSPHDILYHMEAEHNVRGRLERAPAFHQCPSCPFEDNQKGKLSRHLLSCAKKYRPERNQEPPLDFEPPAKIPRVSRNRPNSMSPGTAVYQAAMSGLKQGAAANHPLLPKLVPAPTAPGMVRGRGRPQMINRYLGDMRSPSLAAQQKAMAAQMRPGMLYRPSGANAQPQVLLPTSYQLSGTQLYQVSNHSRGLASASAPLALPTQNTSVAATGSNKSGVGASTAKLLQQPSISITPLPRQQPPAPSPVSKPGRPAGNSKATFVICEICDGYIKDLEQLRNHMQWIHKVKIHPKMIYNRPPLNCQKCQFRFFTDQGLERHLLGSHGLVTSSMQEAANKGKDGGRCPVCGRVYQWKLLNHVARDHNMSLKPAHLSYKCTVCTATFGMYKQFENHVYSAHSVVAKRVMDKKPSTSAQPSTSSSQGDMLKPLKINDEITIIPQPARSKTKPASSTRNPQKKV